jgi:hypothetical protein
MSKRINITLKTEAYERLKQPGQSFSDMILEHLQLFVPAEATTVNPTPPRPI